MGSCVYFTLYLRLVLNPLFVVETMKKILFLVQNGVGGAERMAIVIAKMFPVTQYEVIFCIIRRGGETAITDFIPEGYRYEYIEDANAFRIMWNLFKLTKRINPDVVFSSAMYLSTKILPFKFLLRKKRFVIRCENYLYTYSTAQKNRVMLTYPMADAIIAQTEEMADELYQLGIRKVHVKVVHNPIDSDYISEKMRDAINPYPSNKHKVVVASGRFAYQKGFDLLIKAFAKIAFEIQDLDLYILGDTNYEDGRVYQKVMSIAKKNGIENRVYCVGFQNNPYPYIRFADCFCLSSRWEGLPNVLVESLYLGTPVAAFQCIPVIERIVTEGVNGYVAKAGEVESLATAIKKTLKLGRVISTYSPANKQEILDIING